MKKSKRSQRMTKIKHFINKYNYKWTNVPSEKDHWKKTEKNNLTIVLNFFCAKKIYMYSSYVSKHKSNHQKQVILLMNIMNKSFSNRNEKNWNTYE